MRQCAAQHLSLIGIALNILRSASPSPTRPFACSQVDPPRLLLNRPDMLILSMTMDRTDVIDGYGKLTNFRSVGRDAQEALRERAVYLVLHEAMTQGEAARATRRRFRTGWQSTRKKSRSFISRPMRRNTIRVPRPARTSSPPPPRSIQRRPGRVGHTSTQSTCATPLEVCCMVLGY